MRNSIASRYIGDFIFVIAIYDVNVKIVSKVMKIMRQYLNHVQNSVFEGEITIANLIKLESKLNHIIDKEQDSVIIYKFKFLDSKFYNRKVMGCEKRSTSNII